jgi:flagella basal body P-ring formation protein FlgA
MRSLIASFLIFVGPVALPAQESVDSLLSDIAASVKDHFGLEGDLVIHPVNAAAPVLTSESSVRVLEFPGSISPQFPIRLRFESQSGSTQDLSLVVRANLWRTGWKLRQPSQRGELVDVASFEAIRVDALRDRDAVTSLPTVDHVFSRSVQKDRTLSWRDIAPRPEVKRGQIVEVVAQSGPVSVSLKGMALQDGARNETIRVRNLQSSREFTAEVTGPSRAAIRL